MFSTQLKQTHSSFMHKAIPYKREERQWIKEEVNKLCDTGVMRKVDSVQCASNVVLVK